MKDIIEETIEVLVKMAASVDDHPTASATASANALRYTQAAVNLAHLQTQIILNEREG